MGVFKNDVGRPSNKTITIRNILKGILVIILAAAIFAGGYALNSSKKTRQQKSITINKKEAANIIKVFNDVSNQSNKYGYFYKEDRSVKNIDNDIILVSALSSIEKKGKTTYTKYEVKKSVKKIFGDIKYIDGSVVSNCYHYKYDSKKAVYYSSFKCNENKPHINSMLVDYKLNGNKLVITNKIGIVKYDFDKKYYIVYNDLNANNIILEGSFNSIEELSYALTPYKWTFVKDNNENYTFKSVKKEITPSKTSTTTVTTHKDLTCLDISKLDSKNNHYEFNPTAYNGICYGSKKIDLGYDKDTEDILIVNSIVPYKDLLVVTTGLINTTEIHILDKKGVILGQYDGNTNNIKVPTYRSYAYKHVSGEQIINSEVKDEKVYIYSNNLGQDYEYTACKYRNDSDGAEYVDVIEYKNGKLSDIKNISKKTVSEWKKEHKVDCTGIE